MWVLNPLTPRVKPWVMQSFLAFDSIDRLLKCDHSLKAGGQYLTQIEILEKLPTLDLAVLEVKGLTHT